MKTDQQLKSDVSAELARDPAVDSTSVGVSVKNSVVTLSGQVDSYARKHAIERAVRRVAGVRGIALDLDVKLAPDQARSDADIAQAALTALRWHSMVPDDKVRVEVEDGWVTLSGEVDWAYQLMNSEQAVRPLIGVRGVSNRITVRRHASAQEIQKDIAAALARQAERDAKRIRVEVDGAVVTLCGEVHSMAEHEAAIGTAYGTRGVGRVVDQLQVVT